MTGPRQKRLSKRHELVVYPERRHNCRVRVRTSQQWLCSMWCLLSPHLSVHARRHTSAGSSLPSSAFLFPTLHSLVLCLLSDSRSLLYFNSLLQLHSYIHSFILQWFGWWYLDLQSMRLRGCPPTLAAYLGSPSHRSGPLSEPGPLRGLRPNSYLHLTNANILLSNAAQ